MKTLLNFSQRKISFACGWLLIFHIKFRFLLNFKFLFLFRTVASTTCWKLLPPWLRSPFAYTFDYSSSGFIHGTETPMDCTHICSELDDFFDIKRNFQCAYFNLELSTLWLELTSSFFTQTSCSTSRARLLVTSGFTLWRIPVLHLWLRWSSLAFLLPSIRLRLSFT